MIRNLSKILCVLLAVVMCHNTSIAQKNNEKLSVLDQQYEVQYIGVGQDGTKVFNVKTTAKDAETAIAMAKRDAVAACLFRGITVSEQTKSTPAIVGYSVAEENIAFFEGFLALPTKKTPAGQYVRYINRTGQPQAVKEGKLYKVSLDVQVLYDELLKYMQEKGYAKKVESTVAGKYLKPILMVVPSDVYCTSMGYVQTWTDETGEKHTIPNYNIFSREDSRDLRLVIASLNDIFNKKGFEVQSLEYLLKSMNQEKDETSFIASDYNLDGEIAESPTDMIRRTAHVDYIVDLDFSVMEKGVQRYVTFDMRVVDQSSNAKELSHAHGDGKPSMSATVNTLLEEAVLNHMDGFCKKLSDHYVDMSENGRQITVKVKRTDASEYDFNTSTFMFEDEETSLGDIIYYWLQDNTVDNNPTRTLSPNILTFNQVMMPITKTGRRGAVQRMDTNEFGTMLQKYLSDKFQIPSTVYMRGPSEVWIIL